MITKAERAELRSLIRTQLKVLRAEVVQRKSELLADVDEQIAGRFTDVDKAWADAAHLAQEAVLEANRRVNDVYRELMGDTHVERMYVDCRLPAKPARERIALRQAASSRLDAPVRGRCCGWIARRPTSAHPDRRGAGSAEALRLPRRHPGRPPSSCPRPARRAEATLAGVRRERRADRDRDHRRGHGELMPAAVSQPCPCARVTCWSCRSNPVATTAQAPTRCARPFDVNSPMLADVVVVNGIRFEFVVRGTRREGQSIGRHPHDVDEPHQCPPARRRLSFESPEQPPRGRARRRQPPAALDVVRGES